MKTSNPSPLISLLLPEDVSESYDDGVSSYWKRNDTCLLQISCESGAQLSASQRLSERTMPQGIWRPFDLPRKPEGCDAAAATLVNDQGNWWVHAYFVWKSLAIHATISRQGPLEGCVWALDSLATIRHVDADEEFPQQF